MVTPRVEGRALPHCWSCYLSGRVVPPDRRERGDGVQRSEYRPLPANFSYKRWARDQLKCSVAPQVEEL